MLVLLAAPSFDVVAGWRMEQEATSRRNLEARGESTDGLMSEADITRFVLFYERLTKHILKEMPNRADLVVRLDGLRRPIAFGITYIDYPSPPSRLRYATGRGSLPSPLVENRARDRSAGGTDLGSHGFQVGGEKDLPGALAWSG